MSFSSIPVRAMGDDTDASWWNTIRTKLLEVFGSGVTAEAQFTIADNQSSYADITDFTFDSASFVWVEARYSIYRTDGSTPRRETGILEFEWDNATSAWLLSYRRGSTDSLNIASSIAPDTTGTVGKAQYKSDSMGGTYVGKMRWKIINTISVES